MSKKIMEIHRDKLSDDNQQDRQRCQFCGEYHIPSQRTSSSTIRTYPPTEVTSSTTTTSCSSNTTVNRSDIREMIDHFMINIQDDEDENNG
jgi:hypothetical protein